MTTTKTRISPNSSSTVSPFPPFPRDFPFLFSLGSGFQSPHPHLRDLQQNTNDSGGVQERAREGKGAEMKMEGHHRWDDILHQGVHGENRANWRKGPRHGVCLMLNKT